MECIGSLSEINPPPRLIEYQFKQVVTQRQCYWDPGQCLLCGCGVQILYTFLFRSRLPSVAMSPCVFIPPLCFYKHRAADFRGYLFLTLRQKPVCN